MKKVLTTRVPRELVKRLERVTETLHTDKATLLRSLISKGINEVERDIALDQHKKGEISLGKMADLLHMTRWDVLDLLKEKGLLFQYGKEDLEEDLHALDR